MLPKPYQFKFIPNSQKKRKWEKHYQSTKWFFNWNNMCWCLFSSYRKITLVHSVCVWVCLWNSRAKTKHIFNGHKILLTDQKSNNNKTRKMNSYWQINRRVSVSCIQYLYNYSLSSCSSFFLLLWLIYHSFRWNDRVQSKCLHARYYDV